MTLEEMITHLEDSDLSDQTMLAVVEALRRLERLERAGQDLRQVTERLISHGILLSAVKSAMEAWDAATKGDGNEVNFKAGAPRNFSKIYGEDK